MPETSKKFNPQIHDVYIGLRELRKMTIYPLAAGHQLELTDMISEAIAAFVKNEGEGEDTIKFISFIVGLVKKNIGKIIKYISEEEESVLDEISNDQLADIVTIVYRENFEGPVKKVWSLFQGEETNSSPPSKKPVQRSVRHMDTP